MVALVGFERMTLRVLDDTTPTLGTNMFVIEGKKNGGATSTATISGLSADVVKTYGSNGTYYTSRKGTGDVKVEFELIDIPEDALNAILGYKEDTNGIVSVGKDTEAPDVSVLLESETITGDTAYLGFEIGSFAAGDIDMKTLGEKAEELAAEKLTYSVVNGETGKALHKYVGSETAAITALKASLKLTATV